MNLVTTCIGDLPEELREVAINEQRERRKKGISITRSCLMSA